MTVEHPGPLQDAQRTARRWIRELSEATGLGDEQQVYHVLCASLRALRDQLPRPAAVQLGSHLPVMIRGLYYDGWRPAEISEPVVDERGFIKRHVEPRYHARPLGDLTPAVRAVFTVLDHNLSREAAVAVLQSLPRSLQGLWPGPTAEAGGDPGQRASAR